MYSYLPPERAFLLEVNAQYFISYKHFNTSKYQKDLESVPFPVAEAFDSAEDSYSSY